MPDDKKGDQIAGGGAEKPDGVITNEQVVELVKFLTFRIEAQVNSATTEQKARESREQSDRTDNLWWQRLSILGTFGLSALTLVVITCTLIEIDKYTSITSN